MKRQTIKTTAQTGFRFFFGFGSSRLFCSLTSQPTTQTTCHYWCVASATRFHPTPSTTHTRTQTTSKRSQCTAHTQLTGTRTIRRSPTTRMNEFVCVVVCFVAVVVAIRRARLQRVFAVVVLVISSGKLLWSCCRCCSWCFRLAWWFGEKCCCQLTFFCELAGGGFFTLHVSAQKKVS